jgi:hypothetical protein
LNVPFAFTDPSIVVPLERCAPNDTPRLVCGRGAAGDKWTFEQCNTIHQFSLPVSSGDVLGSDFEGWTERFDHHR